MSRRFITRPRSDTNGGVNSKGEPLPENVGLYGTTASDVDGTVMMA